MFRTHDVVVRLNNPIEGSLLKGERAIVKGVIDSEYMTLEGHAGQFLQSNFRLDSETSTTKQTVSDLEAVEDALHVIDNWNRTHPTGAMISIEAHCTQDGGSTFLTQASDSNDISEFITILSMMATDADKQSTLRRAMELIGAEIHG